MVNIVAHTTAAIESISDVALVVAGADALTVSTVDEAAAFVTVTLNSIHGAP
jgi:hypothetical protein